MTEPQRDAAQPLGAASAAHPAGLRGARGRGGDAFLVSTSRVMRMHNLRRLSA